MTIIRATNKNGMSPQLAFVGPVRQLVVDTAHYKYNASAEASVDGCSDEIARAIDAGGRLD
jgi:allantoicase